MADVTINELAKGINELSPEIQKFYKDLKLDQLTSLLEFERKLEKKLDLQEIIQFIILSLSSQLGRMTVSRLLYSLRK